jgi:nicotinamide/nicotinate riboside kinase
LEVFASKWQTRKHNLMASSQERKAIIVGISGASCSGKTTLARLLRDIFPNSFVIHEDDFYKPEAE